MEIRPKDRTNLHLRSASREEFPRHGVRHEPAQGVGAPLRRACHMDWSGGRTASPAAHRRVTTTRPPHLAASLATSLPACGTRQE